MRVISLGWGIQSFGLAAMSALGVLPPVDAAIHADTGHERTATYEFAARWTPWLEARGVRVVTVSTKANGVTREWGNTHGIMIPAFTSYPDGRPSGKVRRQCTREWKIRPVRAWLQANRHKQPVEMWLGITLDEAQRIKPSDVKYITNTWPFLDSTLMPDGHMWQRIDVTRWFVKNGMEIPPKSACSFCPFHDRVTWKEIKDTAKDWQEVVMVDVHIRHHLPNYIAYLTKELHPIDAVDFSSPEDNGQLSLWGEECTGMCGV